jgi:serine protease Do
MKRFVVAVLLVLLFALGVVVGRNISDHPESAAESSTQPEEQMTSPGEAPRLMQAAWRDSVNDEISNSRRNAITRTVAKSSSSIVGINVIEVRQYRYRDPWGGLFRDDPFFRHFFGDRTYEQRVQGLGSGFLISPDGYILTNDHVAGNAKEITVTLTNGEKYKAELIGSDLVSDIALLKIDGKDLPHLKLGNSDDVIIGEWVIAFGNPFGLFDISDKPTVTVGVVSATGMNLRAQEGRVYRGMIQTDAAINSGNSGGPLLNSAGEVIGVNAVIYTPNQGNIGLGFAIPINKVKTIVAELKRSGKIERDYWTGLEIQTVDARVARYFGLEKAEGVIISDVKRGSPAERAGFKVGDIVIEINGERVFDDQTMAAIVNTSRVGEVLRVKVIREKRTLELNLKLERRSA